MNIPENISSKIGFNLHNKVNHPINIIKNIIYKNLEGYDKFDTLSPYVSTVDNFDKLLIPKDHPSRSLSDTYYIDTNTILRTHTTAHQNNLLEKGLRKFLVTGDVYRKDSIDRTHYPIFHQMEGVHIFDKNEDVEKHLKNTLSSLIEVIFPDSEYRFNTDYFPFTEPSFEVEVFFEGRWLEILGCGIIHKDILKNNGLDNHTGWAFGLGLERLAMILFKIPDIRYFWTRDERFHKQFADGILTKFEEYSKYPTVNRDISFWVNDKYTHNDICDIVRDLGGDLVEDLTLIDEFKKNGRVSKCYRIVYRSNERTLTNEEINIIQDNIREELQSKFKVELR